MDAPSGTSEPGDGGVLMLRKTNTSLPKLSVPLRTSAEATLKGLNVASPGPMTFVSSLFAGDPYADQQSFANLFPSPDAKDGHSDGDSDGGESQPSTHSSRLKLLGPAKLPIRRSPCLTIPPGFSPTTFFDSPLLFPSAQVQPSPTTGTYQLLPPNKQNAESISDDNSKLDKDFVFKPHTQIHSSSGAIEMGAFGYSHQHFAMAQSIPQSVDSKSQSTPQASAAPLLDAKHELQEKPSSTQAMVPAHLLPQLIEKPSEDGYKWRKYGQKQVKGSEYPRSYYKCTHPSCPVKKKVERSYDGQITEIVYKGEHNHTKPQASQKMALANTESFLMANERNGAYGNVADLSSSALGYPNAVAGASELSQGSSSDNEGDDAEISRIDEHNEEDPELKRRKTDNSNEYANNMPLRTVHESRVVVQTTSDVDILDDGYRWRKYGQKVVKGNTHPRSYYKCTNGGCLVRKQVERSSKDPKSVITTYEGKHNHEVPTGKSGSHNDTSATSAPRMVVPANDGRSAVKPAVSLQEQILGQNRSIGAEAGCDVWMSDPSFSQKNVEHFGDSLMGCGYGSLPGDHYYQQEGLALVPKEEPGFVHSVEASLRPPNRNAHSSFYSSTFPP